MPNWSGSNRRSRLPPNWDAIRSRILRRDGYRCTFSHPETRERCPDPATDVDHVTAGDDHKESNLTSLCGFHHRQKSSREGNAALLAQRRRNNAKFRRSETHPGLIER